MLGHELDQAIQPWADAAFQLLHIDPHHLERRALLVNQRRLDADALQQESFVIQEEREGNGAPLSARYGNQETRQEREKGGYLVIDLLKLPVLHVRHRVLRVFLVQLPSRWRKRERLAPGQTNEQKTH